jgi:hypothetical protein
LKISLGLSDHGEGDDRRGANPIVGGPGWGVLADARTRRRACIEEEIDEPGDAGLDVHDPAAP